MRVLDLKQCTKGTASCFIVSCSALIVIRNENKEIDSRNCLDYHQNSSLNEEIMDFQEESVS